MFVWTQICLILLSLFKFISSKSSIISNSLSNCNHTEYDNFPHNFFHPNQTDAELIQSFNFQKSRIVGITYVWPGKEIYSDIRNDTTAPTGVKFVGGIQVEMFWYLRDALNFTAVEVQGNSIISYPNGSLGGMVVQIDGNEADISISQNAVTLERSAVVAFLHSTTTTQPIIVFRQPGKFKIDKTFSAMLNSNALIVIAIILFMSTSALTLMQFQAVTRTQWSSFLLILSIICRQGSLDGLSANSAYSPLRIVIFVLFSATTIIHVFLSGLLLTMITQKGDGIKSLKGLIATGFNTFAMDNSIVFSDSVFSVKLEHVARFKLDTKLLKQMALSEINVGVITSPSSLRTAVGSNERVERLTCDTLSMVPTGNTKQHVAMFVKRGNYELKNVFNIKTVQMLERGIVWRLRISHQDKIAMPCLGKVKFKSRPFLPLEIQHVLALIVGFCGGLVLSFIILWAEIIVDKIHVKGSVIHSWRNQYFMQVNIRCPSSWQMANKSVTL